MTERTFDWKPYHDPRNREFPVRSIMEVRPPRKNKQWRVGPILDQGREGACVGFGWTAEALATPVRVDLARVKADVPRDPQQFAQYLYKRAQQLDPWEGEDYSGTSTLAGAKALKEVGLLKEYRWAFNIEDVIDAVLTKGPVVLGIYWYDGMYSAPDGVLRVHGNIVGGHCLTAVGFRLAGSSRVDGSDTIVLQNSWGRGWGVAGLAEITVADLRALLENQGEACVAVKRGYGR